MTLRRATIGDANEIARLLTVLGHATTSDEVLQRYAAWSEQGNFAIVAERGDGTLCGLATTHITIVLHRPLPIGRITALVVDTDLHGQGIGRRLVHAVEDALRELGCGLLEITSNVKRVDAHAFYERLGYNKTSVRLARHVGDT